LRRSQVCPGSDSKTSEKAVETVQMIMKAAEEQSESAGTVSKNMKVF
jgi:hypothetical protein